MYVHVEDLQILYTISFVEGTLFGTHLTAGMYMYMVFACLAMEKI